MATTAKPRWLPALLACIVSSVLVPARPTVAKDESAAAQAPVSADVVFRHYL